MHRRTTRIASRIAAFVALTALVVVPVGGATVRRMELDEVRSRAESIFVGQVVGTSTRLGSDGSMVWTDYEIEVSETLAGLDSGRRTTLSFAGGTHPGLSIAIPGVPRLKEGDHYVFFAAPRVGSPATLRPMPTIGWGQGLFRLIRIDGGGGSRTALVSADGEPLELSGDGRLMRGAPVSVVDDRIVEQPRPAIQDGGGRRVRPTTIETPDGIVRPMPATPAPKQETVRTARTLATLDDLRLFAEGRLSAVPARNR